MLKEDFAHFANLIDGTWELNPNWKPLSPTGKALFFKALQHHPIDVVQRGFTRHIQDAQRGRFQPVPADILAGIDGALALDGRPGIEEAWALSLAAQDEANTIVWTEEMQGAFAVCSSILNAGDEIGARMAFKEAYNRLVSEARSAFKSPVWNVSMGTNAHHRITAIQHATNCGRLPAPQAKLLLPNAAADDEPSREGISRLKQEFAKLKPASEKMEERRHALLLAERFEADSKKSEIARQVEEYERNNSAVKQ